MLDLKLENYLKFFELTNSEKIKVNSDWKRFEEDEWIQRGHPAEFSYLMWEFFKNELEPTRLNKEEFLMCVNDGTFKLSLGKVENPGFDLSKSVDDKVKDLLEDYKDRLEKSNDYLKTIVQEQGAENEDYEVESAYNLAFRNIIGDLEKVLVREKDVNEQEVERG